MAMELNERFNLLFDSLSSASKPTRKAEKRRGEPKLWAPADKSVAATIRNTGTAFDLTLKSKDAGKFGAYISANLDALYLAFRDAEQKRNWRLKPQKKKAPETSPPRKPFSMFRS